MSVISTVSGDQEEILASIIKLYVPAGRFDLDPTYSRGMFYTGMIPEPRLKFDVSPYMAGVQQADVRHLPFPDNYVESVIFDPPFLHAHGKESKIGNRFSSYPSQKALRAMYAEALVELHRVLKPGGILAFKCQDIVESGKQVWNHIFIYDHAIGLRMTIEDLFILTATHRMIGHNHHEQKHARKFNSFFWVLRKGKAKL